MTETRKNLKLRKKTVKQSGYSRNNLLLRSQLAKPQR